MNNTTDTRSDSINRDDHKRDETKSPERLEREVDQARSRLGSTADELSDRLSPGELLDQAMGMAREHGGEFGRNLGAQVKNNPVPMVLTGIGLSWMMMSSNPGVARTHNTYASGAGRDRHGVGDVLGETASNARDKASAAGDHMHDAAGSMKESAQNAQQSLTQFYREQPLLAGSLGVALGAALGALVPPTETEDNMFGEARDRSVEAAKSKAESTYDEVRESARSS